MAISQVSGVLAIREILFASDICLHLCKNMPVYSSSSNREPPNVVGQQSSRVGVTKQGTSQPMSWSLE